MTVNITPKPEWMVGKRFVFGPPPIFPGPPTPEDEALALELFATLDAESLAWYRGRDHGLIARLEAQR